MKSFLSFLFVIVMLVVYAEVKNALSGAPTGRYFLLIMLVMVPLIIIGSIVKYVERWIDHWKRGRKTINDLSGQSVVQPSPAQSSPPALPPMVDSQGNAPLPTVAFLRPFAADRIEVRNPGLDGWMARWIPMYRYILPETVSIDDGLRSTMPDVRNFVAIGDNTEQIGATKIESTNENWRALFDRIVPATEAVVIVPGVRPGTEWEIARLRTMGKLPRCLFLLLPMPKLSSSIDAEIFGLPQVRAMLARLGINLPEVTPAGDRVEIGDAVVFDEHGAIAMHVRGVAKPGYTCVALDVPLLSHVLERLRH
jgi:hypothetical protein